MNEFSVLLVVFTALLALGVLLFLGSWLVSLIRGSRHPRGSRSGFERSRIKLLRSAAAELGGEVLADPRVSTMPYLRSQPPDPPYGLALAPSEEHDEYIPVFEAPVSGGVFIEAWPKGSPYPPARVSMGGDGLAIGDSAFDDRYIVRSDDLNFARSFLGPETRALMDEGARLGSGGRLRLNLDPLRIRIRKEEALSTAGDLASLTRVGLALLERVRETAEAREGVQFFDAPPPAAAKPNCPVCAGPVTDRRVACRRCKTPHHRECWEYARACSMFACGETRFSL